MAIDEFLKHYGRPTVKSSIKQLNDFFKTLNDEQRDRFRVTCFGHLLGMKDSKIVASIVTVLASIHKPVLTFAIGGVDIKFSLNEIAVILGLKCVDTSKRISSSNPIKGRPKGHVPLRKKFFEKLYNVTRHDLFTAMSSPNLTNDEHLSLSLLYVIPTFLIPRGNDSVDLKFVDLADDMDAFNNYPWGRVVYKELAIAMMSIELAIHKASFNAYGCLYALQVWAYEHIPKTRGYGMEPSNASPRILRWKPNSFFHTSSLLLSFKSDVEVIQTLLLTANEKKNEFIRTAQNFDGEKMLDEEIRNEYVVPTHLKKVWNERKGLVEEKVVKKLRVTKDGKSIHTLVKAKKDEKEEEEKKMKTNEEEKEEKKKGKGKKKKKNKKMKRKVETTLKVSMGHLQRRKVRSGEGKKKILRMKNEIFELKKIVSSLEERVCQLEELVFKKMDDVVEDTEPTTTSHPDETKGAEPTSSHHQLPVHSNASSAQEPLILKPLDWSDPRAIQGGEMQNGDLKTEPIVSHSKKLQDDMEKLGLKIKRHQENMRFLKTQTENLDESILDMQVSLGKYHSSNESTMENGNLKYFQTVEDTTEQILQQEKSAAGILCQLKIRHGTQASYVPLTKDVLGIVATLGKVDDDNISRIFSEYLGLETMMAIVCKTYEGVKALEMYDREGRINNSTGLSGLGSSIGRPMDGRFMVICLEYLRPYVGNFVADDPQRRLALLKPRLPSGECPPGFLGFAVNMINLESMNLYNLTVSGHGLRETLFFSLFSRLQVYRTRAEMQLALPCISDGALSLDGGMVRSTGVFSLGDRREVEVRFPISSGTSNLPVDYIETEDQIKNMKWEKERIFEDMQREQTLLNDARNSFESKKQEFVKFLAESSAYATQYQIQSGGR